MAIENPNSQHARRRRAQQLSINELLQNSVAFDKARPKARILSGPTGRPSWQKMALKASAAIAASAVVIVAFQAVSPKFSALLGQASHQVDDVVTAQDPIKPAKLDALAQIQSYVQAQRAHSKPAIKAKPAPALTEEQLRAQALSSIKLPAFDVRKMNLTSSYIEELKVSEGKRLTSYLDNGLGSTWTIGYGHTGFMPDGRAIGPNMTITDEQADALLQLDLQVHINHVYDIIEDTPVTQSQFEALVDFSFNKGPERLADSTLLKKLVNGDYIGSADEYLRWTKVTRKDADGKPVLDDRGNKIMDELPGLVQRAKEKRATMLSAFSPDIVDTLDRGLSSLQIAERSLARAENRLRPVRLSGTSIDRDALALGRTVTELDRHVDQLQKKVQQSDRLITRITQESKKLEQQYKNAMLDLGNHIDASGDQWKAVVDLANQAHVLNQIALLRQMERDNDQAKLNHYQAQSEVLILAADTLQLGGQTVKSGPQAHMDTAHVEYVINQVRHAGDQVSDLASKSLDRGQGKLLLDSRPAQQLLAALDRIDQTINEQRDTFIQTRYDRTLASARPQ